MNSEWFFRPNALYEPLCIDTSNKKCINILHRSPCIYDPICILSPCISLLYYHPPQICMNFRKVTRCSSAQSGAKSCAGWPPSVARGSRIQSAKRTPAKSETSQSLIRFASFLKGCFLSFFDKCFLMTRKVMNIHLSHFK